MSPVPFAVRLRVSGYALAASSAILLPWVFRTPVWLSAAASATLFLAGVYALWCYWPRWTLGLGRETLAELPEIPGQPFRLSFDDGPTPGLTDPILDLLAERGIRASFFVLVSKARRHPDLVRRIVADGHVLGLHGEDHASPFFRSTGTLYASLAAAHEELEAIADAPVTLYRPSHGWKNLALVRALRRLPLRVANWHAGVWDTDAPPAAVLTARLWQVTPESPETAPPVILLHDGLDDDPARPRHADALLDSLRAWLPPARHPGTPARHRGWRHAAMAAVWIGLAWWAFRHLAWRAVWDAFQHVPATTVAGVIAAALLATVFQALRFFLLFPGGLGAGRHVALNFALQAGNVLLPARSGEVLRPFYMKRWNPALPVRGLIAWSIVDKFTEVLAFLPFIAAGCEVLDTDPRFAGLGRWIWPALALAAVALLFVFPVARRNALRHVESGPSPRRLAASLACSALGWGLNLVIFRLMVPDWELALALLVAVNVAAAIPALPAGLGAFEAAFVWVGRIGGLSGEHALALALVTHIAQVLATLAIGVPALSIWGWPQPERSRVNGRTPGRYRLSNLAVYASAVAMVTASGALWRPVRRRARTVIAPRPSSRPLRIALVSEFFYPTLGGIQDHLHFFSRELLRRGHEPLIVTPRVLGARPKAEWWPSDLPPSIHREVGVSLPYFVNGSLGRLTVGPRLGHRLGRLLRPEHVDLAHLHSPLAGTLPILAMANAAVPVVGTVHTSFGTAPTLSMLRPLAQRQMDALSAGIAVSPISLASIRRYLDFDATLIPNGIDTALFRPRRGPDDVVREFADGRVNIFFIGRPDPRNGLDALIRAFARVHRALPRTRLLIAGDGELMYRYRQMVAALVPDTEAVVFLGAVRDERPRLYRTADIHVFTVERAAFSLTLLEGMASGLPIVTTNWDGHDYMGTPGRHFETVGFDDDRALEHRLVELVLDPARREALGRQARAHALNYDWSVITDRILDVYDAILIDQLRRAA